MIDLTDKERTEALKTVKIGSPEEVFWTDAKRKLENSIMTYTESLLADKQTLELAIRRIAEEKEKFK